MEDIGLFYKRPKDALFYGKDIDRAELIVREAQHYQILSQPTEDEAVFSMPQAIDEEEKEFDFLQTEGEKLRLGYISKEAEKIKEAKELTIPTQEQRTPPQIPPSKIQGSILDIKA